LMLTAAVLMWKFEFRNEDKRFHIGKMSDNERPETGKFRLKDHITAAKDGPMLQFSLRESI
jgi:hypothetical protein